MEQTQIVEFLKSKFKAQSFDSESSKLCRNASEWTNNSAKNVRERVFIVEVLDLKTDKFHYVRITFSGEHNNFRSCDEQGTQQKPC